MDSCHIPFRLALTCTFSSLFVFTPTPHPANQTNQQPLGLMAQSLETEELMTLELFRSRQSIFKLHKDLQECSAAVDGLDRGCDAIMPGVAVSTSQLCSCSPLQSEDQTLLLLLSGGSPRLSPGPHASYYRL